MNLKLGFQSVINAQNLSKESIDAIKQRLVADLEETEKIAETDYNLRKIVPELWERLALLKDIYNFFNADLDRPIDTNLIRREDLEKYLNLSH